MSNPPNELDKLYQRFTDNNKKRNMNIEITADVTSRECVAYIDKRGDLLMGGFCIETSGTIYESGFNPFNAKIKIFTGDKVTLQF